MAKILGAEIEKVDAKNIIDAKEGYILTIITEHNCDTNTIRVCIPYTLRARANKAG